MDEKSQTLLELGEHLAEICADEVAAHQFANGELSLHVESEHLQRVMRVLKTDTACLFHVLIDVCGVDFPERTPRFDVVYNLLSLKHNLRLKVKVAVDEDDQIPTVAGIFPSAGWYEREVWDLYGVFFTDHPDLRRILTDYGFDGHPLRKDFPLTGHVEMRYDDEQRRVVYEPVKLTQDFRNFDFLSPWEGMTPDLPGDEKAVDQEDAEEQPGDGA
ncbi:MAG: NADH-quinone oxidoreductase subunit C [Rhodospirillaceae bacterium]|nr:NADH-quinone oxidoreductase subunit C [Rhodospirillaceae bacterium]MBL24667.1 NADH-quinone oxidoreductase subunit C [Rhodospirillaceae bacterium]